jgi:cytochrome b involved in lipid metabolism
MNRNFIFLVFFALLIPNISFALNEAQRPTLPGDFFYFFKELTRSISLTLTFDQEKRMEKHIQILNEKVIEIRKVKELGDDKRVILALKSYEKSQERALENLEKIDKKERASDYASNLASNLKEINDLTRECSSCRDINNDAKNKFLDKVSRKLGEEQTTQLRSKYPELFQEERKRIDEKETTAPLKVTTTIEITQAGDTYFTAQEVAKHDSRQSCYSIIRGNVYDLTNYIDKHPGGPDNILSICGKDGTDLFNAVHGGKKKQEDLLRSFQIGKLK